MLGDATVLVVQDTKSLILPLWARAKVRVPAGATVTAIWLVGAFVGALAWGVHAQAQVDRIRPVSYGNAAKAGYDAAARQPLSGAKASAPNPTAAAPIPSARELDCMALAVYYEARGESASGQAAVAQVVLNRIRHPAYPKSVCGVVYQGLATRACQFSFVCGGVMNAAREPEAWARSRAVAARALGGYVMAQVGQATQFHAARRGSREHAAIQLGHQVFYTAGHRHVSSATVTANLASPVASLSQGS